MVGVTLDEKLLSPFTCFVSMFQGSTVSCVIKAEAGLAALGSPCTHAFLTGV